MVPALFGQSLPVRKLRVPRHSEGKLDKAKCDGKGDPMDNSMAERLNSFMIKFLKVTGQLYLSDCIDLDVTISSFLWGRKT